MDSATPAHHCHPHPLRRRGPARGGQGARFIRRRGGAIAHCSALPRVDDRLCAGVPLHRRAPAAAPHTPAGHAARRRAGRLGGHCYWLNWRLPLAPAGRMARDRLNNRHPVRPLAQPTCAAPTGGLGAVCGVHRRGFKLRCVPLACVAQAGAHSVDGQADHALQHLQLGGVGVAGLHERAQATDHLHLDVVQRVHVGIPQLDRAL